MAQAFLIVELSVSILLIRKQRLQADVLVSPRIWTGTRQLGLLPSCHDQAVTPVGRVGVLLST